MLFGTYIWNASFPVFKDEPFGFVVPSLSNAIAAYFATANKYELGISNPSIFTFSSFVDDGLKSLYIVGEVNVSSFAFQ